DLARPKVDRSERGQPPGGEDHAVRRWRPGWRDRAADESGIAALRDDPGAVARAHAHDLGDLAGRTRADHAGRGAGIAAGAVGGGGGPPPSPRANNPGAAEG